MRCSNEGWFKRDGWLACNGRRTLIWWWCLTIVVIGTGHNFRWYWVSSWSRIDWRRVDKIIVGAQGISALIWCSGESNVKGSDVGRFVGLIFHFFWGGLLCSPKRLLFLRWIEVGWKLTKLMGSLTSSIGSFIGLVFRVYAGGLKEWWEWNIMKAN